MEPLVTTGWLAGEFGKPDLVVFDATKYLPNEPKDGHAEFLAAHIPGARPELPGSQRWSDRSGNALLLRRSSSSVSCLGPICSLSYTSCKGVPSGAEAAQ